VIIDCTAGANLSGGVKNNQDSIIMKKDGEGDERG
jgi:hypothetical protein